MGLKRKVKKTYSIDEMINIINKDFIHNTAASAGGFIYVLSSTCFQDDNKRFIMCDSKDNESCRDDECNYVKPYYGKSILEAVTRCFVDRANHG